MSDSAFATALREAIRARGISMERIRDRLRERGTPVSVATLSYWQSGRSQPERQSSLVAVGHLEQVLELDAGALISLLGAPRPRGRAATREVIGFGELWPEPLNNVLTDVDTSWDTRLSRVSLHDRVEIGPDRTERTQSIRQVLRAEEDGVDRWVGIFEVDEPGTPLPVTRAVWNCRIGTVSVDLEAGLSVTELVFPKPLARGETILTEHALDNPPPQPQSVMYERRCRLPVKELLLEIRFDPSALPSKCVHYTVVDGHERPRVLTLDAEGSVHALANDFGPGRFGIRWEWD
ncbi:XRE family transcriptional regulator [Actinokineospora alba]|uniref:XRE family transcriptional regulator n=1 Tax=Actinokineospora alba TaxID=504798 RepID=UPI001E4FA426|nr:XRE family transcriptional regulator [Actinokineospora alba]